MDTPTKGFKWDSEAERDLFGACLVIAGEPKAQTLAKAHQLLQETRGVTYTLKAAQHRIQHLQKLKRKDGAPGSENATPVKKPAAAGKKRGKGNDDDDSAAAQEPSKKKRATPKKSAKLVKAEADDEVDDLVKNEQPEDEEAAGDAV